MPLKDELQREFYLTLAASERWSKRTLQNKIDGMLFERTAISGKPDEFIKKELSTLRDDNVMSPDLVFKSPYFLEFTGLKGFYSEKTLEDCLLKGVGKITVPRRRKLYSAYELSLRDLDEGRVYKVKDVDDLFRQCLEEE